MNSGEKGTGINPIENINTQGNPNAETFPDAGS